MPSHDDAPRHSFQIENLTAEEIRQVADIYAGLTDLEACGYPATVTPIVEYGGPDGIDRVIGWGPMCDHEVDHAVVDQ